LTGFIDKIKKSFLKKKHMKKFPKANLSPWM